MDAGSTTVLALPAPDGACRDKNQRENTPIIPCIDGYRSPGDTFWERLEMIKKYQVTNTIFYSLL
jgi:hypothetical protein